MENKTILVLIIILAIIGGFMYYNQNVNQTETFNLEDTTFHIPTGYHKGDLNDGGDISITNGTHSVYIAKYNSSNINKYIKKYISEREKQNESISISNLTLDNKMIYKSTNQNTSSTHYWFIENNNVYSIYEWGKNDKIDSIAIELINSMKTSSQ